MIHSRLFRLTAMLLAIVLLGNSFAFAKKPADPAAMKAKIQARGVGQGVRVTLSDQTEVKGVIVAVHDQSFAVKPKAATEPQEIEYVHVTGVHNDKLSRGAKVGIVAGAVAAGIVVFAVVITYKFEHAKF